MLLRTVRWLVRILLLFLLKIVLRHILLLLILVMSRQLLNEVTEPTYLSLQLAVLALIVIDLQLDSLLINIVNPLLVLPTNSQRSQITEMQLNNVITHSSHDL